jgi:hypothetical protein
LCRDYGASEPKFDASENWVMVTFHSVFGGEMLEAKKQGTVEELVAAGVGSPS